MNNDTQSIPRDANIRKFTGIWIPAEIWEDANLPGLAKMLYAEIGSFGDAGCWKRSDELREPLGVSAETFQKLCRQLREAGYITERRAFGRIIRQSSLGFAHRREIPADEHQEIPGDEQPEIPGVHKEYSKSKERTYNGEATPKAEEFGRTDINELAKLWESEVSVAITTQADRRQLYNIIRKYGPEGAQELVRRIGASRRSGDRFAPQILLPRDIVGKYSKLPKLEAWEARQPKQEQAFYQPPAMPEYSGAFEVQSDEEREKVSQMMKEARQRLGFAKKEADDGRY